jgi:hypothetical protein
LAEALVPLVEYPGATAGKTAAAGRFEGGFSPRRRINPAPVAAANMRG